MNEPYFPNQSAHLLQQEAQFRAVAATLAEAERLSLYSVLSSCVETFASTAYRIEDDMVVGCQNGRQIFFPRPIPMVKLALITFGYEQWLQRKYSLPGFVEVRSGDIVVDCGAYVGGFSLSAAKVATEVHAFEPDSRNALCARRNLADFQNVHVLEFGLYDRSDEMTLNVSSSSVEHSLLQPDDNDIIEKRRIRVLSLADYARTNGIARFDFVKIEAEGVEIEVFAGLNDMRPRQLAIDVSPERNGQSPATEFRVLLEQLGYEVRQRGQVMFARLNESGGSRGHPA